MRAIPTDISAQSLENLRILKCETVKHALNANSYKGHLPVNAIQTYPLSVNNKPLFKGHLSIIATFVSSLD